MRLIIILVLFSFICKVSCKTPVKALTESLGQEVIEIDAPIKELPMGIEEEPIEDKDERAEKVKTRAPQTIKAEFKRISTTNDKEKNMKDVDKIDGLSPESEEDRIEKELAEIYKDTADYKSDSAEEDVAKEVTADRYTQETTAKEYKTKYDENKNDSVEEIDEITKTPTEKTTTTDTKTTEVITTQKETTINETTPQEVTASENEEINPPIGRQRNSFKLHPDSSNKADIERFRTSPDEIKCINNKMLLNQEEDEVEKLYMFTVPRYYKPSTDTPSKAFDTVASRIPIIAALLYIFFSPYLI